MLVTIEVTQEMLTTGTRASCASCPVALGVTAVLAPQFKAKVSNYFISILEGESVLHRQWRSNDLAKKMLDIDSGFVLRPFSFLLEIPDQYLRKEVLTKGNQT